ncbi:DUF4369 domain-containing protein [Robiginitalea sp. M366]|uniref:DUF4369 domain-containing protein n=1 Tax=Robiginitalea aestuariiviva TaxID=3036903 RepID=UPI00240D8BF9|nr:DUF4369 domain-containing protein [Robiginitalea aestuariiviva]MDG1573182.1 DUF4369 domain-containing protein [Robiginitalea aestuariiviva]
MKKVFIACLAAVGIAACSGGADASVLEVHGEVKGLKKGKLLLQTVQDSSLVTLDSMVVEGNGAFTLSSPVEGADLYYLYLDKADNNTLNDRIIFFSGPGQVEIRTKWDAFEPAAEISGSPEQALFAEYRKTQSRFHVGQLELNQAALGLSMPEDSAAIDSIGRRSDMLVRRSYLYALNFAITHKDSYLAPFIAYSEVGDANPVYLDSVYRVLPDSVAGSKYGKKLAELLEASRD